MKKIFQSIVLLLTVALLSSCLKSKTIIGPDSAGSKGAIIEWDNPDYIATATSIRVPRYEVSVTKGTASQLKLRVHLVGTGKAATDNITVGIGVSTAAYNDYVSQAGATHLQMPAAWYNMPSSVVIPAGGNNADFTITINTNNYVAGSKYAIPLSITSTTSGTISGNFGNILVAVNAN